MPDQTIDIDRFKAWLEAETGLAGQVALNPIRGGGSCEMFELLVGERRWALRRAPVTAVSSTAHDVLREQRVILALQNTAVRVPEVLAACGDASVLGADFFIMAFVDGEVIRRKLPQRYIDSPGTQLAIGEELIDALAELHAFEWRGTDIEAMARPENFLGRQVDRWMSQLEGYRQRDLNGIDKIAIWLNKHRPATGELTVMHGDYKTDNLMFSKSIPPRVLSLVDFEMTTVGDPLIDLAWAMIFWPEADNMIAIAAPGSEGGMHAEFCQPPALLIQRYAESTGRDLRDFQWYQAFAAWKLAIVLEASYAKFLAGTSDNPNHEFFGYLVDQLLLRAQRFSV